MLSIYGEEASQNSTLEPWLVSPMAFSGDEAYSELFPLLILDSFPENITRITTLEENTLLYINQLKKEKNTLFQKINDIKSDLKEKTKFAKDYFQIQRHKTISTSGGDDFYD